jgi:hypothetical protein
MWQTLRFPTNGTRFTCSKNEWSQPRWTGSVPFVFFGSLDPDDSLTKKPNPLAALG